MLGLPYSSKLDQGSYIISIARTASKKIGALICSMKSLSPEVALYHYKSNIRLAWDTVVMSEIVFLAATKKCQIRNKNGYVGLLELHLLPLLNPCSSSKCSQLKFFLGITSVDVHLSCLDLLHFVTLVGGLLVIDYMIFAATIPICYKDVCDNSFFPRTARLWNRLFIECFRLIYDLNGFMSRINKHPLFLGSS